MPLPTVTVGGGIVKYETRGTLFIDRRYKGFSPFEIDSTLERPHDPNPASVRGSHLFIVDCYWFPQAITHEASLVNGFVNETLGDGRNEPEWSGRTDQRHPT